MRTKTSMGSSYRPEDTSPLASERYRTLLEINNAIMTHLQKQDLFRAACRALERVIPFDAAGVAMYEPEMDAFRFFALEGDVSPERFALGSLLDPAQCCFGAAFRSQRPVLRKDLAIERIFPSDDELRSQGMRSYCTVPLCVQGKSIGALSVVSRAANRYTAADAGFLREVANQLALAIANMLAYEEIGRLEKRLQMENHTLREEVREAESQVLMAENVAVLGRFAAALTHDLNTPIGAIRSAIASSLELTEKEEALPPDRRGELSEIKSSLRETMRVASDRLSEILSRMRRFTNLDRSDVLSVDLNAILRDVVGLLEGTTRPGVRIELDLQKLPHLRVRPQQISSVFMGVVQNALDPENRAHRVALRTRPAAGRVEVVLEDDGRGLGKSELREVFEPTFTVKGNRIATGNWSLLGARQIVRAHGGRIEVESCPGGGTRVLLTLPLSNRYGLPESGTTTSQELESARSQLA